MSSIRKLDSESFKCRLILYPYLGSAEKSLEALRSLRALPGFEARPCLFYSDRKVPDKEMKRLSQEEAVLAVSSQRSDAEVEMQILCLYHLRRKIDLLQFSEAHWHETSLLLKEMNAQLEELSNVDPLTNLSNRRHFDEVLQVEWKRALRHESPISVLMLDIDFFKRFNDTYGHLAGDDCLQQVAACLKAQLRRPSDLLARYGGEEFVVLLPQTDEMGAQIVAESLRRGVEGLEVESGGEPLAGQISISVGVATLRPRADLRPESLVDQADQALYQAKETGRNRVCSAPAA